MKITIRMTWFLVFGVLVAGCHSAGKCPNNHCQDSLFAKMFGCDECEHHCDVDYGAIPQPVGSYVRMHNRLQHERGNLSQFVIHRHEWYQGGTSLGPAGRRHVHELAERMVNEQHSVIVEPADPDLQLNPEIDEAMDEASRIDELRRDAIVQSLLERGVADAGTRVVIGWPKAEGLRGDEASRVFGRLNQGGRGGNGFGGGGTNGGNMGGGGGFGGGGQFGGGF